MFLIEAEGWEGIGNRYRLPFPHERLAVIALEIKEIDQGRVNLLSPYKNLFKAVDEKMVEDSKKYIGNRRIKHLSDSQESCIKEKFTDAIIREVISDLGL